LVKLLFIVKRVWWREGGGVDHLWS